MRPQPRPTPETARYWEGTAAGELRLEHCIDCATVRFPPQPFCRICGSDATDVRPATGAATLVSYVITHRPAPGLEPPFVIAMVRLAEGPSMLTNLVGVESDPGQLEIDMALEATFVESDEETLVCFTPASRP